MFFKKRTYTWLLWPEKGSAPEVNVEYARAAISGLFWLELPLTHGRIFSYLIGRGYTPSQVCVRKTAFGTPILNSTITG